MLSTSSRPGIMDVSGRPWIRSCRSDMGELKHSARGCKKLDDGSDAAAPASKAANARFFPACQDDGGSAAYSGLSTNLRSSGADRLMSISATSDSIMRGQFLNASDLAPGGTNKKRSGGSCFKFNRSTCLLHVARALLASVDFST
uniref:Uncharacterized protein n=1 Tax=Hyaloperonospora arabidopsidis (strain Emoy2) TaxID=559515 RepID=M4BHF1_HYAAE